MDEHWTLWIWMNTEHYGYGWTVNIMDMDEHWTRWTGMNKEHCGKNEG